MEIDLQQVFTILDENGEGQIQLQRFVDVANNYYSDAGVSAMTDLIDWHRTPIIVLCDSWEEESTWAVDMKIDWKKNIKQTDIFESQVWVCPLAFVAVHVDGRGQRCSLFLATRPYYQSLRSRKYWFHQLRTILRRYFPNQFLARFNVERSRLGFNTT